LGVTRAGYYAWKRRRPSRRAVSDRDLKRLIGEIFVGSRETYGAPRIHAELADEHGIGVARKRVARLMRELGIQGDSRRRKGVKTTTRAKEASAASDLVRREFRASGPDRLWVADIKYVPSWQGYVFLAVVVDAFSRKVIGWSMRDDLRAELALDALGMALQRRKPRPGLVHHSDRGSQGGFNWSSQHLVMEVVRDGRWQASAGDSCDAWADVVAGPSVAGAAGGSAAVLAGDRGWMVERGGGPGGGGVAGGWQPLVPRRWRDAANLVGPAVGALSIVC
jgi:putative transposase